MADLVHALRALLLASVLGSVVLASFFGMRDGVQVVPMSKVRMMTRLLVVLYRECSVSHVPQKSREYPIR